MTTISPFFVGRQGELGRLARWVSEPARKPILITGMGGMGKTALVKRFVDDRYAIEQIAWLSFYSLQSADQALDDLFERTQQQTIKIVVLDDIDQASPDVLARFLSRLQRAFPSLPVILTSRDALDTIDAATVALSSLSTKEAVSLLQARLGESADPQLRELAETLGNHPRSLELVASYARDRPVREVLQELQDTLYEIQGEISGPPQDVIEVARPKIVIASDLLLNRLQKQPGDIHRLSSRQFEELVARLLDGMGWEVHLTPQTRDGGRDILAYLDTDVARFLCLVETKKYDPKRPVGIELVRTLYGTLHHEQANAAMLVTTSYFSPDAQEFQKQHAYQISLKDYRHVVQWLKRVGGAA